MAVIGALIIQAMNTGILLSGFPPEFNLIVKAGMIILILLLQSPLRRRNCSPARKRVPSQGGHPDEPPPASRSPPPPSSSSSPMRCCVLQFPNMLSTRVLGNFLTDNAFLGIAAVGMTFVIISGGIDLSVGSVIGFTGVLIAVLISWLGHPSAAGLRHRARRRGAVRRGHGR